MEETGIQPSALRRQVEEGAFIMRELKSLDRIISAFTLGEERERLRGRIH